MADTSVPPLTALGSCRSRRPRRWGRWVYSDRNGQYGCSGWLLDGSPLVLDFMPGMTDCEPGRGLYLLYNWPGHRRERIISRWCRLAMDEVEEIWDEYRQVPCGQCGRSWDDHQVEGTKQERAVSAWLTGCAGYVFPPAAIVSARLREWMANG